MIRRRKTASPAQKMFCDIKIVSKMRVGAVTQIIQEVWQQSASSRDISFSLSLSKGQNLLGPTPLPIVPSCYAESIQ